MNVEISVISEIGKMIEPLRKDIVFTQAQTINDLIENEKAIENAVDIFYKKMLEDPKVAPFFKSIDMTK